MDVRTAAQSVRVFGYPAQASYVASRFDASRSCMTSPPCQDVGHSLNRRVHVLKRGRQTEAEAHPVAAMVGVNVDGGKRCFDGAGLRRAERKKVAVVGAIAERRDEVGAGQALQAERLQTLQEVRHQPGRMSVDLIDRKS